MRRMLLALLLLASLSMRATSQTSNPPDRIRRSGGQIIVNADGSINVTTASGKTTNVTPQATLPATCVDGDLFYKTNTGLFVGVGSAPCVWNAFVRIVDSGGGGGGGGGGVGTVTSITAGAGLSASPANPITGAGTLAVANTGVVAGSYTCPTITINSRGQITSAADGTCTGGGGGGGGGSGTVTSVGLSLPSEWVVTGSPVTGAGVLTVTKASQAAGTVYAAPAGSAGAPSFRALVSSDFPDLTSNVTLGGDVTGAAGANTIAKLKGFNLDINANLADGSILAYNSDSNQFENSWNYTRGGITASVPALSTSTNITVSAAGWQTKSGGTGGSFDAGGITTNSLTQIGSITASVGASSDVWCIGLDVAPSSVDCADFDYAIRHNADGTFSTLESGSVTFTSGTVSAGGDLLEVEKINSRIRFKINRATFRVLPIVSATTLKGVTSISTAGGVIPEVLYYSGAQGTGFFSPPVPADVDWVRFGKFAAFKQRAVTPPAPASGQSFFYAKTDGRFYRLGSSGAEAQLMDTGTAAGGDLGNVYPNPSVEQLRGRSLGGIPPVNDFLADTFEGSVLNADKWTSPTGGVVVSSGRALYNTGSLGYLVSNVGTFTFADRFVSARIHPENGAGVTMRVVTDAVADEFLEIQPRPNTGTIRFGQRFASNSIYHAELPYVEADFAYVRIAARSSDNHVIMSRSPDGVTWTQVVDFANAGASLAGVVFQWIDLSASGAAYVDDINSPVPVTDPISGRDKFALLWDNPANQFSITRALGVVPTVACGAPPSGAPQNVPAGHTLSVVEMCNPAVVHYYNTGTGTWQKLTTVP